MCRSVCASCVLCVFERVRVLDHISERTRRVRQALCTHNPAGGRGQGTARAFYIGECVRGPRKPLTTYLAQLQGSFYKTVRNFVFISAPNEALYLFFSALRKPARTANQAQMAASDAASCNRLRCLRCVLRCGHHVSPQECCRSAAGCRRSATAAISKDLRARRGVRRDPLGLRHSRGCNRPRSMVLRRLRLAGYQNPRLTLLPAPARARGLPLLPLHPRRLLLRERTATHSSVPRRQPPDHCSTLTSSAAWKSSSPHGEVTGRSSVSGRTPITPLQRSN